jgi:hypothetical protein
MPGMSSERKQPDPMDDLRQGFGLLFRAAKTAIDRLPTKGIEEVVLSGAKEVERAVRSVAQTLEEQVSGRAQGGQAQAPDGTPAEPRADATREGEAAAPPAAAGPEASAPQAAPPADDERTAPRATHDETPRTRIDGGD